MTAPAILCAALWDREVFSKHIVKYSEVLICEDYLDEQNLGGSETSDYFL